jgi:hypothetical protein
VPSLAPSCRGRGRTSFPGLREKVKADTVSTGRRSSNAPSEKASVVGSARRRWTVNAFLKNYTLFPIQRFRCLFLRIGTRSVPSLFLVPFLQCGAHKQPLAAEKKIVDERPKHITGLLPPLPFPPPRRCREGSRASLPSCAAGTVRLCAQETAHSSRRSAVVPSCCCPPWPLRLARSLARSLSRLPLPPDPVGSLSPDFERSRRQAFRAPAMSLDGGGPSQRGAGTERTEGVAGCRWMFNFRRTLCVLHRRFAVSQFGLAPNRFRRCHCFSYAPHSA